MNHIQHYLNNKETFDFWIEREEKLQPSMEILQPLIKPYKEANPEALSCSECIIEMLKWTREQSLIKADSKKKK